jgi:hypothetical protein
MRWHPWLLHPFLGGIYFVLTLAAANATALLGWRDLVVPSLINLGLCSVYWVVGFALSRNPDKASLLSLLWLTAFSVFGYAAEHLRPLGTPGAVLKAIGGEPALGILFAIVILGPSLAICRATRPLEAASRYLTLVAIVLVAYTSARVYRGMPDEGAPLGSLPPIPSTSERTPMRGLPDIYLVVLDKYTNSQVLAQHFGFDNGDFERFLRSRGFVIPRYSQANYPGTQLALASLLNLDYIQNLPGQHRLDDLIENNRLAKFLSLRGYRFVFFPTAFRFTSHNRHADLQLPLPQEVRGEFRVAWERTTLLPELARAGCALFDCEASGGRLAPETAELMDWKFERMIELAGSNQPTFVLAHLLLPHEPFIYRADCSHRTPYWPANAGMLGDKAATDGYLEQISCVNRKLSTLVDSIIARSRRPPVILLQADHGHGRLRTLPEYREVDAYRLRERMAAFSAYLLPGVDTTEVGDSITPVNGLRLMLRRYFGADLPPLEDASYWSSEVRPLVFSRIEWTP